MFGYIPTDTRQLKQPAGFAEIGPSANHQAPDLARGPHDVELRVTLRAVLQRGR